MLKITNAQARRLWLANHGLAQAPTGPLDVMGIIRDLGFVQLDTIQVVSRAHHHILWSRNQNYREKMFDPLLAKDRAVFEHYTHDASIIPMETLPYWRRQFQRKEREVAKWFKSMPDDAFRAAMRARIAQEGALSTHAWDTKRADPSVVWSRPPHKMALDYMWYKGDLATCYRENFKKFYNLPERVFPDELRLAEVADAGQINWLCTQAMERLGFATAKELQGFWEAMTLAEARDWMGQADLMPVEVQAADGSWREAFAVADIEARIAAAPDPTSRLRILNPFDPAIRDRDRLKRLFGMDYKIEIFVPAAKRKYGYYVYPLLEGARMVGRVEVAADRKAETLKLVNLWPEKGVKWTMARTKKLDAELDRLARFIGCRLDASQKS
ncbi:winged helix-turn-helix domain-containing protein [Algirhabdus cladophorae]|uniref:winged helix-turn-helix domain-containing protein n=1 Tax=Algirhabdus cladophorae TaxID=3377108 RepID=UPI003B8453CE